MEKKPRPHAELIIAWANGASIQYRKNSSSQWVDSPDPAWVSDYEYRVKPAREYPVTLMTDDEIEHVKNVAYARITSMQQDRRDIINAALRHAIDNGQVVTREEFDKLSREYERAAKTLTYARFTDHGGELWKPPIGNAFKERQARDLAVAEAVRYAAMNQFGIHSDEWKSIEDLDLNAVLAGVKA